MLALLSSGADVNRGHPQFGWTALHYASGYGKLEAAKLLIDNGAVATSRDVSVACMYVCVCVCVWLVPVMVVLMYVCMHDHSLSQYRGYTPLHECCYWLQGAFFEVIELLVDNMSQEEVFLKDRAGRVAFHYLKQEVHVTQVKAHLSMVGKLAAWPLDEEPNLREERKGGSGAHDGLYDAPITLEDDIVTPVQGRAPDVRRARSSSSSSSSSLKLSRSPSSYYQDSHAKQSRLDAFGGNNRPTGVRIFKNADLKHAKFVAEGAHGKVFRCRWVASGDAVDSGNCPLVAVKVPKIRADEAALKELNAVHKIPFHPNVNKLLGICLDFQQKFESMCFITAFRVDNLSSLLTKNHFHAQLHTQPRVLFSIVLDVLRGLAHLHAHQLVHRDIACRNLLVDKGNHVCITDFGMSRVMHEKNDSSVYYEAVQDENRVPIRWMAPESLEDGKYSEHSDMWSFGITLWEIATGGLPFRGEPSRKIYAMIIKGTLMDEKHGLELPDGTPPLVDVLMRKCLVLDPSARASAEQLVALVEQELVRLAH
jgi:hypothetical protein